MSGLQVATTIGADTVLNEATLQGFKAGLSGELLRSSDGDVGINDFLTLLASWGACT